MKYSDIPAHIRPGYLYRWLRGGIWLFSMYGWTRVTKKEPRRLEIVLWLSNHGFHVEDHRYFY